MRISDWSSDVCSSDLAAAEGPASALDADAVVAEQPIFDLAVDHGDAGVDLLDLRDLSRRRLAPDQIVEAERRRQPRHRTERRGEAGVGGREGAAAGDAARGPLDPPVTDDRTLDVGDEDRKSTRLHSSTSYAT